MLWVFLRLLRERVFRRRAPMPGPSSPRAFAIVGDVVADVPGGAPFPIVHVGIDGSAREVGPEERAYLRERFTGDDGGRAYLKSQYEQLTPDGELHGYLPRDLLPPHITPRPVRESDVVKRAV
jgi:hypothetical protein